MNSRIAQPKVMAWLLFRALRWVCWIAFFAVCFYVRFNRSSIVTSLNQLPQNVELLIYVLGCAAVFAGFFELMMREKTGLARPRFGQLIPMAKAR